VTFSLDARAFAYYSVREKRWEVEPGTFEILVGSSSRDIRSREVLTLQ
jgi:beta-glucosidase